VEWRFEDLDDYWSFLNEVAGAVAMVIERLSPEERGAVRAAIGEIAEPFRADGGYVMPGVALNALAS
jgi:hypothetical protein